MRDTHATLMSLTRGQREKRGGWRVEGVGRSGGGVMSARRRWSGRGEGGGAFVKMCGSEK